jgi:hypothetical protein
MSNIHIPASSLSEGFWDGRQFRMFHEIVDLAAGSSITIRAQLGIDVLLNNVNLTCDRGSLKLETIAGGTEAGSFNTPVPSIPKNTMPTRIQPHYQSQVNLALGGSVSGGIRIDVLRRSSGGGSSRPSVGGDPQDIRGVAAGLYYFRVTNNSNQDASGVISSWWEELTE